VLALPGLQIGLLGQRDGLLRGRWTAVVGLELRRQFSAADVDRGPPRGPRSGQVAVDADDLADRPLTSGRDEFE
jgi:hypothetical protein